jgi:hypothetical protein
MWEIGAGQEASFAQQAFVVFDKASTFREVVNLTPDR